MTDIFVKAGKKAIIVDELDKASGNKMIILQENAKLTYLVICRESDVTLEVVHEGVNAQSDIFCIFVGQKNKPIKAMVSSNLRADDTSSNVYMLSLLWDGADIHVDWAVDIGPGIHRVAGHLLEENLILGKKIKIKTLPMLDVKSNDVTASHGCRIDKVDPDKVFYMMSKGVAPKDANRLIVEWYLNNILDKIDMPEKKDELWNIKEIIINDVTE